MNKFTSLFHHFKNYLPLACGSTLFARF